MELDKMKTLLETKYHLLRELNINTFTLNKEIEKLCNDISDLENKIKILEDMKK